MSDVTNASVVAAHAAMTETQKAARKRRNAFIGWGLLAYVVLVFIVTLARLSDGGLQINKLVQ